MPDEHGRAGCSRSCARLIGGPLPTRPRHLRARPPSRSPRIRPRAASSGPGSTAARRGFPQVINCCKSFSGPTGLEEQDRRRLRHRASGRGRGRGAAFRQRPLFLMAAAGAGSGSRAGSRPGALRVSHVDCRPRPVRLRAVAPPSLARRADPADRDVPRAAGAAMTETLWILIAAAGRDGRLRHPLPP